MDVQAFDDAVLDCTVLDGTFLDGSVLDASVLDVVLLDAAYFPYTGCFGCYLEVVSVGWCSFGCCVIWMLRFWMLRMAPMAARSWREGHWGLGNDK